MRARLLPSVLLLSLTALLTVAAGARAESTSLSGTRVLSDTISRESVFVQGCDGFDAVTTYTTTRDYRSVIDPSGALVHEWRHVRFAGALANAETGRTLAYDGSFTWNANYDQGTVTISDLRLRLELPDEGSITVEVARQARDLVDNPPALLRDLAPRAVSEGFCSLLGGFPVNDPVVALDLPLPFAESTADVPAPAGGHLCGTQLPGTRC